MTDEGSTRKDAGPQVDSDDVDDAEGTAPVGRNVGSWLLVPIALVMVLLCFATWASIAFGLSGVFTGQEFHLYLNGFGSVSTDLPNAGAAPGHGPSLGAWLVCGSAAVLLMAGALRGLRIWSGPAGIVAAVAALAQIAAVIFSAVRVNNQSGDFFDKVAGNARALGNRATFSVGWGLWIELLVGFLALAIAVGVLVRERNADLLRIRL
ncbi:hypothetical protein [Allobranchiibius sp. GilTou38]|uniref:hypothetical protein n=1 Tax=Allobranchiibius sp. GilTou38 TaxID=2815210 RepID=UPI001AA13B02|nr:hypothetical protein [Allobranchiibius sp. GilTou38]MBO1765484.1 hypothetical protein [Allobranchiibius sp. GilTou38]